MSIFIEGSTKFEAVLSLWVRMWATLEAMNMISMNDMYYPLIETQW